MAFFAIGTTYVIRQGGLTYIESLVSRPKGDLYRLNRSDIDSALPSSPGATLLVGDSILDLASPAFPGMVNRAIVGDTTKDVLERMPSILGAEPSAIILEVGINNLQAGLPVDDAERDLTAIIAMVKASRTALICLTLLPVNEATYRSEVLPRSPTMHMPKHEDVARLNRLLQSECPRFVSPDVFAPDGSLRAEDTIDGLHLDGSGVASLLRALAAS